MQKNRLKKYHATVPLSIWTDLPASKRIAPEYGCVVQILGLSFLGLHLAANHIVKDHKTVGPGPI